MSPAVLLLLAMLRIYGICSVGAHIVRPSDRRPRSVPLRRTWLAGLQTDARLCDLRP